jgi:hypothetical protein
MTKYNFCFVFVSSGFDEKHNNVKTRGLLQLNELNGRITPSGFNGIITHLNKRRSLWKKS